MGSHVGKMHVEDVLTENLFLEGAATYVNNSCEAALALAGIHREAVGWGRHALPGTDTMLRSVHRKRITSAGWEK